MAINKKLIHFNTYTNFNSQKLSANIQNTQYTSGVDGEPVDGNPDILYQSIIFIKDTCQIWTHGQLYNANVSKTDFNKISDGLSTGGILVGSMEDTPSTEMTDKGYIIYATFSTVDGASSDKTFSIPLVTSAEHGLMTSSDKSKLDGIEPGAQVNVVTSVAGQTGEVVLTKTDVNLGNVDNTSDAEKPVSTAQAAAIADAKKAGTDAQAAIEAEVTRANTAEAAIQEALDNHKADQDKKHIPTGGNEGQILSWKSDGVAKWDNLSNIFTGLEELLAYGVHINSDNSLTRIGNMSLHKTLPIQSQLRGCIAQGNKIIYWLDEYDWRFRQNPTYLNIDEITVDSIDQIYIEPSKAALLSEGQFVRVTDHVAKVIYIDDQLQPDGLINCVLSWEEYEDTIAEDVVESSVLEVGSRLDGYDGTVRVYCPSFYIKSRGNDIWLSTVKIDNTWTYQPEILIDAYKSTILNTVPVDMGYLSTLPVKSAVSIVNTATYCRGGNNRINYDQYLDSDIFKTDLGKPRSNLSRDVMRVNARNAGSELLSYDQYKNILYWLYVVEYANFNCREEFNEELTNEGYHQGGLGKGVHINNWGDFNQYYAITPCGYTNALGNRTGVVLITSSELEPINEIYACRWRGIENPFGDIQMNLDGALVSMDKEELYTCQDPDQYADDLNDSYERVSSFTAYPGYITSFNLQGAAHITPLFTSSRHAGTYAYFIPGNSGTTLRTIAVGGDASNVSMLNLGSSNVSFETSKSLSILGYRTVSQI